MGNHLHYGDNLQVLRNSIADESVDLIYLDPPFNSNANYSHLFKDESGQVSGAQIEAFEDTWHWDDMVSGRALTDLRDSPYQSAADMLDAMVGFFGQEPDDGLSDHDGGAAGGIASGSETHGEPVSAL